MENQNMLAPFEGKQIRKILHKELTRMKTVSNDAQGFLENHEAAVEGGRVAGTARERVEKEQNISVVSPNNHLNLNSGEQKTLFPKAEE